jgi:hypothetical protein
VYVHALGKTQLQLTVQEADVKMGTVLKLEGGKEAKVDCSPATLD